MCITRNGNIGIANISPIDYNPLKSYTLNIGDSSVNDNEGSLIIHRRNTSGGTRLFRMGYDISFNEVMGDFGANNSSGTWINHYSCAYNAPASTIVAYANGNVFVYGYLVEGSDHKLKTDIKTIENALWKVKQLRGVEYTHTIEKTRNIGLIAQEVEYIIPEVVIENTEGTKGISYANLVSVLINAIKEQQEIIDNQQNQLEASTSAIKNIMNILERNNIK
jgi:hypothetical protein